MFVCLFVSLSFSVWKIVLKLKELNDDGRYVAVTMTEKITKSRNVVKVLLQIWIKEVIL